MKALLQTIPLEIAAFTQVIYFPDIETVNHLLLSHKDFRSSFELICYSNDLDKLETLAVVMLGIWNNHKTELSSVNEFLVQVHKHLPNYYALKETKIVLIDEVATILSGINNFDYTLKNGYFEWNYCNGLDSGTIPYPVSSQEFSEFQRKVIASHPKSFSELEGILL